MESVMSARASRLVVAVLVLAFVVGGFSCRNVPPPGSVQRAWPVNDGSLSLVASPVAGAPDFYHGRDPKVAVRIAFDPSLVELRRVSRFKLWVRVDADSGDAGSSGMWAQVGETTPQEQPIHFEAPGDGRYGLRASVVYENGQELFRPLELEEPQLWYVVDRTAPRLTWNDAIGKRLFAQKPTLELAWTADDRQFGREPVRLSYSLDGGGSWKPIGQRDARSGADHLSWIVPREVSGAVRVRVSATDLAGNSSHDDLELRYSRGVVLPAGDGGAVVEGRDATVASAPRKDGAGDTVAADAETDGPGLQVASGPSGDAAGPDPVDEGTGGETRPGEDEASRAPVRLLPPETTCLRGGGEFVVRWEAEAAAIDRDPELLDRVGLLEYSFDTPESEDAEWMLAGEAAVGAMGAAWLVPQSTDDGISLRLVVVGAEERSVDTIAGLSIDAAAPIVACTEIPEQVGGHLSLAIQGEDVGCSHLDAVLGFVRRKGEDLWTPMDESAVVWKGENSALELDLRQLPEATYDVFLVGRDAHGNTAATPGVATPAMGSFSLDKTPPAIVAQDPVTDWVGGFETSIGLELDAADARPPLVVEAREPDGEWREIRRLASLVGARDGIGVVVPVGVRELEMRVRVTDALGNQSTVTLGPRDVVPPLVFTTIEDGATLRPFSKETVAWTLHAAVAALRDELLVRVAYRLGAAGEWKRVHERLPADDGFEWVLPDGDGGAGRETQVLLRARLYRGTELVGEVLSPSFGIAGFPELVAVSEASMKAYAKGKDIEAAYRRRRDEPGGGASSAAAAGSGRSSADDAEMGQLAREARDAYHEALELDPNNHHASYAFAMLLNDLDATANAGEIASQLEKTIEVQPGHASALINLGAVAIRSGDFERARSVLERAIRVNDSPLARFNLGLSLMFLEKPAEARAQFERALQLDPGVSGADAAIPVGDAWFYTAYSYVLEGELGTARAVYREHEALIPAELKAVIEQELTP